MTDPHELDEAVVEDSDAWGTRQRVGAFLAPAALLGIWFAPFPLTEVQHHLLAIFVATVVLWVTETLPVAVTALLVPPVMAIAGIAKPKELFAPLADPILFIFIGGFMIAKAMTRHGLDRRIALSIVGLRAVGNDGSRVRLAFMGTATLLSMWMSNTATTALLMPILLGVVGTKRSKDAGTERAAVGSLVCLAYACSLGGLGTPVGSPPNLIALRYIEGAHIHMSFLSWMKIGIPSAIACTGATFAFYRWFAPAKVTVDGTASIEPVHAAMSKGERVTALAFGLAVLAWMLPGLFELFGAPGAATLSKILAPENVAMVAAALLFAFRDERDRVLPWREGVAIDWGTVLLFGGGISLGNQLFDSGLAAEISRAFVAATGIHGLWELTFAATLFTIFFTEVCSNTATATMVTPLVIAVAQELQVPLTPPAMAVGLAASCAFMMPISTGPNAIVYGTGRVPMSFMLRGGFLLNVACAVILFLLLRVLSGPFGWA